MSEGQCTRLCLSAERPVNVAGPLSRDDARRSPGQHPRLASRKPVSSMRPRAAASAEEAGQVAGPLKYQHIMLALVDPSPYFGDGSKQVPKARFAVSQVLDHSTALVRQAIALRHA